MYMEPISCHYECIWNQSVGGIRCQIFSTGIREFESIICDILLKRYNERTDNQLRDDTVVVGYDPDKDNPDKDNPDPCC